MADDGSYLAAVAVAQHLHSIIIRVRYDDVACTVKHEAAGVADLTSAWAFSDYSAQAIPVNESNDLQETMFFVGDNSVVLVVPCHQPLLIELTV